MITIKGLISASGVSKPLLVSLLSSVRVALAPTLVQRTSVLCEQRI